MQAAKKRLGLMAREKALAASASSPTRLYHYTNAAGLEGILDSKTIWATQFDFLNDRSEFFYAADVIKERLGERGDDFGSTVKSIDEIVKTMLTLPHYVASFCEHSDLLSQWRGYAQTNDGYAVGFRFQNLLRKQDPKRGVQLAQLIYPRAEQNRCVDLVLDAVRKTVEKSTGKANEFGLLATLNLLPFLHRFKHELFSGEGEWRLIGSADDVTPEKFRIVRGHFVPYIAFPLEADDIDVIVQGPGTYRAGNKEAIERFAKLNGFTPTVISSELPLV
jgi:hypothetical protein